MSKSEKNFIKIKEMLKVYRANAIRMFYVLHKWNLPLDYTDKIINNCSEREKYVKDFFENMQVWVRINDIKQPLKYDDKDWVLK